MTTLERVGFALGLCIAPAACGDLRPAPAGPRTVRTVISRAEGVGVGTRVTMNGVPIGTVDGLDSSAAGITLLLAISRADAPLQAGLRAEVRPAGIFAADVVALVPGDGPVLADGALVPGTPRAATAAERQAAMRIVLPAVGLPALGALVGGPSPDSQPGHPFAGASGAHRAPP